MPTSETASKADSQAVGGGCSGGGSQDVESLVTYQLITESTPASSVAPGQSLLRKVTVEPANLEAPNLNASNFPAQLSDLATLESIQAELDQIQNSGGDGDHIVVSAPSANKFIVPATMSSSADGGAASFLGSLSDSSGIISTTSSTTGALQGGAQIVNLLQNDQHGLGESLVHVAQQVHNVQTKRPITAVSNSSGQVVTKVIITKNPNQSQQMAVPISNQQQQQLMMLSSQGLSTMSNTLGLASPTKTITINPSVMQSPTKYITTLPGSPTKVMQGQKLALSPVRTPTKITMIPVSSINKSPQRIMTSTGQVLTMVSKAQFGTSLTTLTSASSSRPATITMSPSKVILKQQPVTNQSGQKVIMQQLNAVNKMQGISLSSVPNIHPVTVSGSKFQYVRLVTNPATQTTLATAKPASIAPMTLQAKPAMTAANTQMKLTVPSATVGATQPKRPTLQGQQRIILPATSQVQLRPNSSGNNALTQIRPAGTSGAATLTQLLPGTTIISSGQNLSGMQSFALVPAQYVTQQLGQPLQQTPNVGTTVQRQDSSGFVPITTTNVPEQPKPNINGALLQEPSGQRPRKPCNCTKSQCLKLYCDCFANGEFCHNCNCTNCANNLDHEEERSRAIKACLDRNPLAFHPKIGKGRGERRHTKGCNCKRSGCLKNYCECYEAKILCTSICKCVGCKNFEESPDRKTLMHLADAAEVRVQQQTSAKAKLSSQIQDLPIRPPQPNAGERYAYTFVTKEVAEATCACLIAQAEEAERTRQIEMVQERVVLEEFGRCLMQVIESAGRTKDPSAVP